MRNQSYNTFWQRIHQSAREKHFPLRVMFEVTYKCNFNCPHCYVPTSFRKESEKKDLKTKEIFSILDQLKDAGCFYLGFTGGEPFVRKDILDILWYAKRLGFEIIIYTNGYFIDERVANELKKLRPNKVDITIPAMSEDAFKRISRVSGSQDKVFRAIELLRKHKVNLGFKSCVLKENESEIKEIQDFTHSLGALHRLDDMLSSRLDGSKEPYQYRGKLTEIRPQSTAHSPQKLKVIRQNMINCDLQDYDKKTLDHGRWTERLFKCGVGASQVAITPFGELKMCLMIDYPRYKILAPRSMPHASRSTLERASLKGAWERLKKLVSSIRPDENYLCNKCKLQAYCKWCPGKSWLYNRSFTPLEKVAEKKSSRNRESSLTGFTSCAPESKQRAEYNYRMMQLKETEEPKN